MTDIGNGGYGRPPGDQARPWVGLVSWIAFTLAVIAALQIFGAMLAGLAIEQAPFGTAYKIGYSFLTNLDAFPVGLVFIVVVVLAALPQLAGAATNERADRLAAVSLGIAAGFAFILMILSVLAVLARLEFLDARQEDVSGVTQWVLTTFLIRHFGTALVAFVAALVMIRSRVDLGPMPATVPAAPPAPEESAGRPGSG